MILYFTMGGRTKKVAQIIANNLPEYECIFIGFELTGKFSEKLKILDKYQNGDFSMIDDKLNSLDAGIYDLIMIGMPTYGNFPPQVFNEILKRIKNFQNKDIVIFSTARITGKGNLEYMTSEVQAKGGNVFQSHNFRGLFRIGTRSARKFAAKITK